MTASLTTSDFVGIGRRSPRSSSTASRKLLIDAHGEGCHRSLVLPERVAGGCRRAMVDD
jgi:hypothetical protein